MQFAEAITYLKAPASAAPAEEDALTPPDADVRDDTPPEEEADSFSFDVDDLHVSLEKAGADDEVLFLADLGELPDDASGRGLIQEMLKANYAFGSAAGAAFSVDPETHHASLWRRDWIGTIDTDEFMRRLTVFVGNAQKWRERIANPEPEDPLPLGGVFIPV